LAIQQSTKILPWNMHQRQIKQKANAVAVFRKIKDTSLKTAAV